MKSTLFLVTLSLILVSLSGCIFEAQDDPSAAGDDTDEDVTPGPSNTTDPTEEPATPTPPAASLTATNVTGETPLTVAFNLSSDNADARFLDWSFDADGDGTAEKTGYGLPAEATHTYGEAGNFTAVLTVTDMEGLEGNATLDITVTAPTPVTLPDPVTFSGTITGLSDQLGGYLIGEEVEHRFNHTIPVNNITVTFTNSDTAVDLDFVLLRADGEVAEERESFNEPTGAYRKPTEDPMLVEDPEHLAVFGTWTLVVKPYISYEGDYTITVTFA